MKLNQFTKAAKRYSADASLPLNEAQEKLATYFGFRNFDAAQKALREGKTDSAPDAAPDTAFWCGLTVQQFRMLCSALLADSRKSQPEWTAKGVIVLHACIDYLAHEGVLHLVELKRSMGLGRLCDIYVSSREIHLDSDWPEHLKGIANYLESGIIQVHTPSLESRADSLRSGLRRGVTSLAEDQHRYSTSAIGGILLNRLRIIQDAGGPSRVPCVDPSGRLPFDRGMTTTIEGLIKESTVSRRKLNEREEQSIGDGVETASIFRGEAVPTLRVPQSA